MRRDTRTTPLAAAVLLLAACTSAPTPAPTGRPTVPSTPAVGRRDCANSVRIARTDEWRASAPTVGPVAFAPLDYRLGDVAAFAGRIPDADGWRLFKVMLSLRIGARATLSIPAHLRGVAALTYLDGHPNSVSFASCEAAAGALPDTQFSGGFALREPVCLPLEVSWDGRTERLVLDFGVGHC